MVEAMNLGLPIFAFDCVYNRATTFEKAFYWKTEKDILKLLESVTEGEKKVCAANMASLAKEHYTWEKIAGGYNKLYME